MEVPGHFSNRRRNYMFVKHRRDKFFEFIRDLLEHSFVLDCMKDTLPDSWRHVEDLVTELHEAQKISTEAAAKTRLKKMIPEIGYFHTPLKLYEAFREHDEKYCMTKRRFVKPSFNDIRHILNLSQVNALIGSLQLVTFDGDCTLYSDGDNLKDTELAWGICVLLKNNVNVALVTAAGYGLDAAKYENRIAMLLESFDKNNIPAEAKQRFFVLGGECNYLLQCGADSHLIPIAEEDWMKDSIDDWSKEQTKLLLDVAEKTFIEAKDDLRLQVQIKRKERAVGIYAGGLKSKVNTPVGSGSKDIKRELLDELVLRARDAIEKANVTIPYCAFNGGNDVWVDVGTKEFGVKRLQKHLKVESASSIHVGDQFSNTGNDFAARSCATTAWVISPTETKYLLFQFLLKHGWCTREEMNDVRYCGPQKGGFI